MSKEYENQNVSYVIHGNYHLPCITVKEQNELHIGVWANRHRQYLKQHHCIRYYNLSHRKDCILILPTLRNRHKQCFHSSSNYSPKKKNVTEKLKANNPMLWVRKMNNIRNRAMEIVNSEVIFV